jgi:hypothetical protein
MLLVRYKYCDIMPVDRNNGDNGEMSITRQRLVKHVPAVTNIHETIEKLLEAPLPND